MAEFTSPEEFEKYLSAMKEQYEAGYVSAKEYNDALKDAATGVKGYTANLKQSMSQLGTSFKQLGKDVYAGKQGAAVFNDTMESGGNAVAAYALKFGPAGIALGLFTKAVMSYVGAAAKQSDALYDSYQKISRSGTIGADAMTQVFESAVKMGYTVDQLGNLGTLLAANSKNFGLFSSSAVAGSKQFTEISKSLQDSPTRKYFMNLGMTVDDINNGLAGFYKQEGAMGQLRGKSNAELIQGSKAYIREMEILTRLTGQTREEMEAQREEALNIDAFYASLMDMPKDAQKEAMKLFNQLYAVDKKAALELASNVSGAITGTTDLLLSTQGQSAKINKESLAAGMTAAEAMQLLSDSSRPMIGITKEVAQVGGQIGLSTRSLVMLGNKGIDPFAKELENITKDVDKAGEGFDSATNSQSKMRDAQIKSAQNLQEFVKLGVAPVTKAMQFLAEAIENLTSFIPGAGRTRKGVTSGAPTTKSGGAVEGVSATGEVDLSGGGGGAEAPAAPKDLSGLRLKSGEATAGGDATDSLVTLAYAIQDKLGGNLKYFSAFNDKYHQGLDRDSAHKRGTALDFTLTDATQAAAVASMVQGMPGVKYVKDEYANLSSGGTGGHIHAEVSAANGAILSGPSSGYRPNLTMHGTEAIVPLNTAAQQAVAGGDSADIMVEQLNKLDEMVTILKNQLSVSTKIMQYSS
jgi:hypothetical protein